VNNATGKVPAFPVLLLSGRLGASHAVKPRPTDETGLRQLLAQARTFPRSRQELIRAVLRNPEPTIRALVGIAGEALDDEGGLVVRILEQSLDAGANAELIELTYRLIPKKSVHFAGLAAKLCEGMLILLRCVRPVDRLMESVLLHNLAAHFRDLGDFPRAAEVSRESVGLLRRLARRDSRQRHRLVNALGMWSKHLSEAGQRRPALRAARRAVFEAGHLTGNNAAVIRAQARVVLGSCLIVEAKSREAIPVLRAANRTLRRLGTAGRGDEADAAHASMFLACAEFNAGNHRQARRTAEAAWKILTRIVAADRGTFIEDFFATADILSLVAVGQGDHSRARQVRGEAGRILRDLARMYPAQFGFRCLWTWVNWASQAIQSRDYPEALDLARAAVRECAALQRKLGRTDDEVLGAAQFNLAVARHGLRQRRAALRAGLAAESAFLRLPEDNERRADLLPQVRELLEASSRAPVIRVRTKLVVATGAPQGGRGGSAPAGTGQ
jgi:hypothetical protein